jgi:hypothetical protein
MWVNVALAREAADSFFRFGQITNFRKVKLASNFSEWWRVGSIEPDGSQDCLAIFSPSVR